MKRGIPGLPSRTPATCVRRSSTTASSTPSNLCTEITLNTSDDEVAVCNLGSVNLANHLDASGALDADALRRTVRTAVRMLDNVIDVNFYTIPETRASNARHRPVGLGPDGLPGRVAAHGHSLCLAGCPGLLGQHDGDCLPCGHRSLGGPGGRTRELRFLRGFAVVAGHPAPGHAGPAGGRTRGGRWPCRAGRTWTGAACGPRRGRACATPT